jgi:methylenetetrahydrofolate dehydrogenase (NADP+) / methenyltetrahydrofolate cyclohydrolase
MTAKIIDGVAISRMLRFELAEQVRELASVGITPGLAVILIGDDPASKVYVQRKTSACAELGIASRVFSLSSGVTESFVLDLIATLNADSGIHGILVQLPLPTGLLTRPILEAISPDKDVDGFHLYNVGGLVVGDTVFPPCTPFGVQYLLMHERIPIEGQNVVVVGASNIVGKPMALMLMQKNATICICHAKTRDLAQFTILADILIVAAGRPRLIVPQMVRTGAVVIDVGINRLANGQLVGDVDFDGVKEKASYLTPVPGGVGPMTVTMLLRNTIGSAQRSGRKPDGAPLPMAAST